MYNCGVISENLLEISHRQRYLLIRNKKNTSVMLVETIGIKNDENLLNLNSIDNETQSADNSIKLVDKNPNIETDIAHASLDVKSASNSTFRLEWPTIRCDILYERFWSQGLTFFILYVGSLTLFTLFLSDAIPYPTSVNGVMSSTVTFIYYGIYGAIIVCFMIPFMYCNGMKTTHSIWNKFILFLFPIIFGIGQYYIWTYNLNLSVVISQLLISFLFFSLGIFIIMYIVSLCRYRHFTYFEIKKSKSIKYVRQLLTSTCLNTVTHRTKLMGIFRSNHDEYPNSNHTNTNTDPNVKTERSLSEFLFKSFDIREVCSDIYFHTPGLLWFGFFLGFSFIFFVVAQLLDKFYVRMTYTMFANNAIYLLNIPIASSELKVTESQFNEFKASWNTSLIISVCLSSALALLSLLWPILAAVNIRYNLQKGLWRYNKKAYISTYKVYTVVDIPGNQVGIVLFGVIIYTLVLQIFLFFLVYPPLFQWVLDTFSGYLVAICIGIGIKMIIVYLIFDVCLISKSSFDSYSTAVTIMLFVNLLYGVLSAFYRVCYYIGYSFVALFRFDVSMLPSVLWSMDSAFFTFNAYMRYQVG